ncbi:MAG: hypothetical protein C0602_02025 [Denitrovibrio sp.]|nr:MAG: hypothetical protein C0602_02025 [Denitrovibrio sp.]
MAMKSYSHITTMVVLFGLLIFLSIFSFISITGYIENKKDLLRVIKERSLSQVELITIQMERTIERADVALLQIVNSVSKGDPVENNKSNPYSINSDLHVYLRESNFDEFNEKNEDFKDFIIERYTVHLEHIFELTFSQFTEKSSGLNSFVISRSLYDVKGDFTGIAVAVIKSDNFFKELHDYRNIEADSIYIYDFNHNLLSAYNAGNPINNFQAETFLESGGLGYYSDEQKILTTSQADLFPLRVVTYRDMTPVLKEFRDNQKKLMSIVLVLVTIMVAIVNIFFARYVIVAHQKEQQKNMILAHQSRMAQIGEMFSNITHQWIQPLNTMKLLFSSIEQNLSDPKKDKESIKGLCGIGISQTMQLFDTIDTFRRFLKPTKNTEPFNLCNVTTDTLKICIPLFAASNISIKLSCAYGKKDSFEEINNMLYVNCSKGDNNKLLHGSMIVKNGYKNELIQVLLNLFANSKDAYIANADNLPAEQNKDIVVTLTKLEDSAEITVTDFAGGMPEHIRKRVFEKDFTTKGDQGTGIGLYLCKTIVEDLFEGEIKLESFDGKTKITLTLPLYESSSSDFQET